MNKLLLAEFLNYISEAFQEAEVEHYEIIKTTLDDYYETKKLTEAVIYFLGMFEVIKLIREELHPNKYEKLFDLFNSYEVCNEKRLSL